MQLRIKSQQYPNSDCPHQNKIDITIVVDMLLTGFDSKYLNTLYTDKNLKHHGLIQAFSRTNRVLNDTKPYGNILDFRGQQQAVDEAIALFAGEDKNRAREIWLVDPAPKVVEKLDSAISELKRFMETQGLPCTPAAVANLNGDAARTEFILRFKEVQRLKTQLDQYTDLNEAQRQAIEQRLPEEQLLNFKGAYLETARRLRAQQGKNGTAASGAQDAIEQMDFEFVLFSSALIDYDYIMKLITSYSQNSPGKQSMSREQLVNMLTASSNLLDERDDIIAYINTLQAGQGLSEQAIRDGYQGFKASKSTSELHIMADQHKLPYDMLEAFVAATLERMIFVSDHLRELFEPLKLGWKERNKAELALMAELGPFLQKQAQGRDISGLAVYE